MRNSKSQPKPQTQSRNHSHLFWRYSYLSPLARARTPPTARPVGGGVAPVAASASTPTPKSPPAVDTTEANTALPVASLYTSQAYTHRRAVGPMQLEVVPAKGLGWRAARDIATGELLLVSLPIAVLYGPPGEPPENEELVQALATSWPRLTPLERRWLLLLGDCCAASGPSTAAVAVAVAVAGGQEPAAGAATTDGGQESRRGAAATGGLEVGSAPSSPQRRRFDALEDLLLRARELLAEAGRQQPATDGGKAPEVTLGLPPAARELHILPPAIFGVPAPAGAAVGSKAASTTTTTSTTTSTAGSTSLSGGGGGGVAADLVRRYSYAEVREDPALSELLDVSVVSCTGLWPEAALINHSCCPNAVLLVVGGAAYVRAGRPVMEGEEVTLSYLGTGVFQDVAHRRSRLRASHGFLCTCPRCTAEHTHFPTRRYPELDPGPQLTRRHRNQQGQQGQQQQQQSQQQDERSGAASSSSNAAALDDALLAASLTGRRGGNGDGGGGGGPLQALLDAVFGSGRFRTDVARDHALLARLNAELVSELEVTAHAVLTAPSRPRQQQAALLERLEGLLEQVDGSCSSLELPPRGRLMVMASVYGVVRLTSELAELSGQATPERRLQLLQLAAEVLEAVAPGSDGHVMAAIKVAGVSRRVHGSDSAATRRAELAAAAAHLARYGRELLSQPALLRQLSGTRRRLATGSGLAASMGVLAWMQHVQGSE